MPKVIFHKHGQVFEDEVKDNTNLVVRAGIKQFPYPNLNYQCGMGKCATCACRVIAGSEHLPPPNWKEKKQLGDRLDRGYRLLCQLWIEHDIELEQDDAQAAAGPGATGTVGKTSAAVATSTANRQDGQCAA